MICSRYGFGLLALLLFIYWEEKRKIYLFVFSLISFTLPLLFMEAAVVLPLLFPAYLLTKPGFINNLKNLVKRIDYLSTFFPVIVYFILRFISGSHWSGGDYSYNLIKLPFNALGNLLGYLSLSVLGPSAMSLYSHLRVLLRENILISILGLLLAAGLVVLVYRLLPKIFDKEERGVIYFGIAFFVIALLPFLGLGNITSRYSYFASVGIVMVIALLIKKVYQYLLSSGKELAMGLTGVGVLTFILFQIIVMQQSYFQWSNASDQIKNFFVSFEDSYLNAWSDKNAEFEFVNVPISDGQAWVFPVGLSDAVWIAIQNPSARINQYSSVSDAIEEAGYSKNKFVIVFKENGNVYRIDRVPDPVTGDMQLIRSDQNQ